MPAFISRPNLEFLKLPYHLEKARMTGLVLSGDQNKLKLLIEPLNTVAGSTRFKLVPAFNKLFLLGFMHYPVVRSAAATNPWGFFRYNEFAIYIPMLDTANASSLCWFVPCITLDSFLPLIAGREIVGLPKVTGRFQMGVLDDPPVIGPMAWKTVASWNMSMEAEVFGLTGAAEMAAWTEIASVHVAKALPWIPNLAPLSFAPFLDNAPVKTNFTGNEGKLARQFLGNLNPGIMLKQFPSASDTGQAVYQRLISCAMMPTAVHGIRFLSGTAIDATHANIQSPAGYPLRAALGATVEEEALLGFAVEMDWTLPAGTEI